MRVTLADGSYVPLYLKLCGNLQLSSSGVSRMVHIGCRVLCHVLPNLTSDVVLGMDWLHAINPWIDWNAYSLSMDCGSHTVRVLGTETGCSHSHIKVCALKLVLKTMNCNKI